MISAIVLTKNESEYILKCINSLNWCDEIVIIDDYSTDDTIEQLTNKKLAKIKIVKRNLQNDFAGQRNFALGVTTGDWVLFVDADEFVPPKLAHEIQNTLSVNQKSAAGYLMKRDDLFLGKLLEHGETAGIWVLRLARKNAGKWEGKVHEKWMVEDEVIKLKNPLMHNSHKSVSSFLQKINWYTDVLASEWMEENKSVPAWQILVYPKGKFLYNYILCLGFLDGIPGLIMAMMMSFHSFLVRGKYWMRSRKGK